MQRNPKRTRKEMGEVRDKNEFYPTPLELCIATLKRIPVTSTALYALDVGAGTGVWGKAFRTFNKSAILDGVELDNLPHPKEYTHWYTSSYTNMKMTKSYDIIFGNPPYSLAEIFIRKGILELYEHGYLAFLLHLDFLESKKRHFGLFSDYPPKVVYTLSKRPSFTGDRKTRPTAYAIFVWQEGYNKPTKMDWLYWNYKD